MREIPYACVEMAPNMLFVGLVKWVSAPVTKKLKQGYNRTVARMSSSSTEQGAGCSLDAQEVHDHRSRTLASGLAPRYRDVEELLRHA